MPVKEKRIDPRNFRIPRRSWSETWADEEARDPVGTALHWAVQVRLGNLDIRVGTGALKLPSVASASTFAYTPALVEDLEITEQYTPASGGGGSRSVGLQAANRAVSAMSLVQMGLVLAGDGEIALARDGMAYEDRYVLVDGDITGGVSFGDEGSAVEFSLSDASGTAGYPVTPQIVDETRHTTAMTQAWGHRYPYVFSEYEYIPALMVGVTQALVCVPATGIDPSMVTRVFVDGESRGSAEPPFSWTAIRAVDDRGDGYIAVIFTDPPEESEEGSGNFDYGITGANQINVTISGGPLSYLHEAVRHLLESYTSLGRRRIHYGLIGEIRSRLGNIPVRLLVNGSSEATEATAIDVLEQRIAPSFPMLSFATVDGKYGPVVTDGRDYARMDLVEKVHLLNRTSEFQESDKNDLFNNFTYRYDYNPQDDTYRKVVTRDQTTSVLCSRSVGIVGERFADVIETDLVTEPATAGRIVDWMVWHLSMPHYDVEYEVPTLPVALRLRLGWNVNCYIPTFGLDGVVATVIKRTIRRRTSILGLRFWWPNIAAISIGGGAASVGGGGGGGGQ